MIELFEAIGFTVVAILALFAVGVALGAHQRKTRGRHRLQQLHEFRDGMGKNVLHDQRKPSSVRA